jgi:6-phosphogluconolactonase (cycloisomerase 2 family)
MPHPAFFRTRNDGEQNDMTDKLDGKLRRLLNIFMVIVLGMAVTVCSGGGGGGQTTQNATMTVAPSGSGTVDSNPQGINQCATNGGTCSASFPQGTQVTLRPKAGNGSSFSGWNGACSGTGPCALTMMSDLTVGAVFTLLPTFTLTVTTSGNGTVTGAGIQCGSGGNTCQVSLQQNQQVALSAAADPGSMFNSWGGACAGTIGPICNLTMTSDMTVQAVFSATSGFDFALSVAPGVQSVAQGAAASYTVTATLLNGLASPVMLTVQSGCPTNATCTFSPNPVTPAVSPGVTSQLTVLTSNGTPVGPSTFTIRGTSGLLFHEVSAQLTVNAQVGPIQNPPRFAYVPNNSDGTLSIFAVNATTGQIRHQGYVNTGLSPLGVTTVSNAGGTFAYVANQKPSGTVSGFTVNTTTGQLNPITGSPFTAGSLTSAVVGHPNGQFLYAVNFSSQGQPAVSGGTVSAYTINTAPGPGAGQLTPIQESPAGKSPIAMVITPNGQYAYVANYSANTPQITAFSVQLNGVLQPLALQNIPVNPAAAIAMHPAGTFLFTANEIDDSVTSYAINANGTLTKVQTKAAGTDPNSLAVDPAGPFLYVSNESTRDVSAYKIESDGKLTTIGAFSVGAVPQSIAVDPSGQFVYTTNYGDQPGSVSNDTATTFLVNANTGALTKQGVTRGRQEPSAMAFVKGPPPVTFTPTFAYVANQGDNNLSGFRINGNGTLTPTSTPTVATTSPSSLAILLNSKFLYVSNSTLGQVSGFAIDPATGNLVNPISPATVGTSPRSVAADSSSRFVYAANQASASVSACRITSEATGTLNSPCAATGTDPAPVSVSTDPTGQFAYVVNRTSQNVRWYKIDSSTGALTPTGATQPAGVDPEAVAVDPTGRFAYVASSGSSKVFGYRINPDDGGLQSIAGSPFSVAAQPVALAAEPTGKFVFVVNQGTNKVSVFRIDPGTGVLSLVGTPVDTGTSPTAVTVDISGQFVYVTTLGTVAPPSSPSLLGFLLDLATGALSPIGATAVGTNPVSVQTTGTIQ